MTQHKYLIIKNDSEIISETQYASENIGSSIESILIKQVEMLYYRGVEIQGKYIIDKKMYEELIKELLLKHKKVLENPTTLMYATPFGIIEIEGH